MFERCNGNSTQALCVCSSTHTFILCSPTFVFLFPNFNYVCSDIRCICAIIGSHIYEHTIHSVCQTPKRANSKARKTRAHYVLCFVPSSGEFSTLEQPFNLSVNYVIAAVPPFDSIVWWSVHVDSINHLYYRPMWRPSVRQLFSRTIGLCVAFFIDLIYYRIFYL